MCRQTYHTPLRPTTTPTPLQINGLTHPVFNSWSEVFILGFRPGSIIVDYKMKVGETEENAQIGKEELLQIIKVSIEENHDTTVFEAETAVIEGKTE